MAEMSQRRVASSPWKVGKREGQNMWPEVEAEPWLLKSHL